MIARVATYTVIAVLAAFVLLTTFAIDHGGTRATPQAEDGTITIHDLALTPESHKGETVKSRGKLLFSDSTKQYQLIDEQGVVVVIRGYEAEALQALSGQEVSVTGRFDIDPSTGIFIEAETVQVLD
jgi:hypothetical protein